jgi:hypothetical protein
VLVARAINVRLDAEAERALKAIERLDGLTTSEAVRVALVEAQEKRFSDEAIREAARRIAEDPAERAESEELDRIFGDPWEDLPL